MAFQLAEAYVEINQRGFKGVRRGISGIAAGFTKMTRLAGPAGLAIAGTLAATGAAAGVAAFKSIKAASDMEEALNKFNVVFGDNSEEVKKWGDNFAKQVGRSKLQVVEFMAGTQDLLVPMGFEPGAATEMSKQIAGLSIDLASFNNLQDADVLNDIQGALTGSGEVMKKYGVIVNETAVKQELLNQGIDKNKASEQQKAQARMNIILRGTTAAQGDAERSAGSYANQKKRLWANISDVSVVIGNMFLPAATKVMSLAGDVVSGIGDWLDKNKELYDSVVFVSENISLYSAIAAAEMKLNFWNGVEYARAAFVYLVQTGYWMGENIGAIAGQAVEDFKTTGKNIVSIGAWLLDNWREVFFTMFDYGTTIFINLGKNIRNIMSEIWEFIKSGGTDAINFDLSPMTEGFKSTIKELPELAEYEMTDAFAKAIDNAPAFEPKINASSSELDKLEQELANRKMKSTEKAAQKSVASAGAENQAGAPADAGTIAGSASKAASNSAAVIGSSSTANILAGAFSGSSGDKQKDIAKNTKNAVDQLRKVVNKLDKTPVIVAG